MPPGKAGGLFGERLGNCSLRCSTSSAAVPDAALPPPSMESCIHAVVQGANNTVRRLKAADFFSFPLEGGRWGWGCVVTVGNTGRRSTTPPPPPPPPRGGGGGGVR